MSKVIVGRPIHGVTVNGDEFLLEDGEPKEFENYEEAEAYMAELTGIPKSHIQDHFNLYRVTEEY